MEALSSQWQNDSPIAELLWLLASGPPHFIVRLQAMQGVCHRLQLGEEGSSLYTTDYASPIRTREWHLSVIFAGKMDSWPAALPMRTALSYRDMPFPSIWLAEPGAGVWPQKPQNPKLVP